MKTCLNPRRQVYASVLGVSLIITAIMGIAILATISLTSFRYRSVHGRSDWLDAFWHAENSLQWAAQKVADASSGGTNAPFLGKYKISDGTLTLPYLQALATSSDSDFENAWVTIENSPARVANHYLITVSAKVGEKTRTVQVLMEKNPPSQVFDYEYFLNNWGWWWGSSITGDGDNRANWDFDFRHGPTVNGSLIANGNISENEVPVNPFSTNTPPFRGKAATDLLSYVHSGAPRVTMPNLQDFSYYNKVATDSGGKLYLGDKLLVDGVVTNATKTGLFVIGSPTNAIRIDGPVVIPGDLVIRGSISGIGTIYVGGNLYIAGNMTYTNGPDFSTPPEMMTATNRDKWVQNSLSNKLDLVAFAVRGTILGGDVNTSDWKSACYDPSLYGLGHVGDESKLGQDGISGTPDDNVPYLHADGTTSAWYDADGDGTIDGNYNYNNDVKMTTARASLIDRYPTTGSTPDSYSNYATNSFNSLDGVFYCNHALALRMNKSDAIIKGSVICRDEAIIFNNSAKFYYDSRIHSRYSNDPNRYIDLGLPVANKVAIRTFDELAPEAGFHITGL